ncbi:hypothetical protein R3W88_018780 [Solanum pinnatisectum]|uniref:DUF4283 domain-containing protein n=1 Tax=Solanum pinnatisectum TaxID=50273 RepID=A0AAV9KIY5_9SOLN|nr:hypothetical protein R3W88_018780 [Solanum pinnatisectum]
MNKVQLGTPWVYDDKYLLNVHPWEPGLKNVSPLFDICNMWVQVWNIPLHWMSKDVGCKIGNTLGGTCDVVIPENNGSKEGRYMRLKVMMNITKPLPRVWYVAKSRESCYFLRTSGGHNTNERDTMVRKHISNLIEGRIGEGTKRNLQHLEKKVDSTNVQLGSRKEDHHRLDQNESKEKGQVSQKASDDDALNIKYSNIIQPMEVTKYGPQEKQIEQDWHITGEETSTSITMQCVDNCLRKKDTCTQLQLDKTGNDNTPREMEEAINTKELQADINQTTTIADHVCTTVLEPYVEIERLKRQIGLPNSRVVDPVGLSGGLCVLWSDDIQVRYFFSSNYFIEVLIYDQHTDYELWCIFVYLSTDRITRRRQFAELVVNSTKSEKNGGRTRESWPFTDFKKIIWNLKALDLGYKGKPWTWWSYRENDGVIQERLDRTLVSPKWRENYENANVVHVDTEASDHAALIISTESSPGIKKKRFYFDKRWCENKKITSIILRAWNQDYNGFEQSRFYLKLKNCK